MVDIVACPKCGKPRALGHRCPSCGDAADPAVKQAAAASTTTTDADTAEAWQQPTGAGGFSAATAPASAPEPSRASGQKKGHGRLATFIVFAVLVVAAIVVAVVLTTGGAAVVEEEAAVAGVPDKASDLAAESLVRNAMTAFDAVAMESGTYDAIAQTTLQNMEPSITWIQGSAGLSTAPPTGANAKQNGVAWVSTGPLSYELGTWSASGMSVGVSVNRMSGGITYYKDGQATTW